VPPVVQCIPNIGTYNNMRIYYIHTNINYYTSGMKPHELFKPEMNHIETSCNMFNRTNGVCVL